MVNGRMATFRSKHGLSIPPVRPLQPCSTMKQVMPLYPLEGSTLANTKNSSACSALEIHSFSPLHACNRRQEQIAAAVPVTATTNTTWRVMGGRELKPSLSVQTYSAQPNSHAQLHLFPFKIEQTRPQMDVRSTFQFNIRKKVKQGTTYNAAAETNTFIS